VGVIRAARALGPVDLLSVRRDPLLRWVALMPLLFALPARFVLPGVAARAGDLLGLDLLPHYPPVMGCALVLFTPAMVGMVVGFLLLDQRDDGTLAALRVTPLPLGAYVAYRLAAPVVVSTALTVAAFPIAGLAALGPAPLLLAALAAAPLAPLYALALAAFAQNKVQGFALVKLLSVLPLAPLVAYAADGPWTLPLALAPTYWPAQVYWRLGAGEGGGALLYLAAGVAYAAVLAALLLRRTARRPV
jgi:fluoroquinolone transport system permease protein